MNLGTALYKAVMDIGCSQKVPQKCLGSREGLPRTSRLAFVDVPHIQLELGLPPKLAALEPTPQPQDPRLAQCPGYHLLYHPASGFS